MDRLEVLGEVVEQSSVSDETVSLGMLDMHFVDFVKFSPYLLTVANLRMLRGSLCCKLFCQSTF